MKLHNRVSQILVIVIFGVVSLLILRLLLAVGVRFVAVHLLLAFERRSGLVVPLWGL